MTVMRDTVVNSLAKLRIQSDENGLVPEYEVLVNLLPVSLLNTFSEKILKAAPPEKKEQVEAGLVRAAYECGYHTGCGVITSDIFNEVVIPMVTDGEVDILRGAYAAFTAWGWAKAGIVQIKEGEKMVVRAFDYYEADGGGDGLRAYMLRGLSQAFFDLAYADPYPDGMDTFVCHQTKGIELGDSYGEFVVTRK
ncbi:MAG TPA: hypothetical protein VJZ16_03840 [Syntrophales bacterium]|jgi:hypothetical protein|nr:hypothetical protein [Geobacteraceae bacterium]HLA05098.1 hypothetical protein [Syntrophales bacterium]